MARKTATATGETRTYILDLKNGNMRKLTIPVTWKLTFGSVVPFTKGTAPTQDHGRVALRFYEGSKDNLRAVMTDVVAFRDASIDVLEKRTSVKRQAAQKQTPKGMRDVVVEARVTEWIDPDNEDATDPPDEFLQLSDKPEF